MQHFGTKYNAALADETRARYEQAAKPELTPCERAESLYHAMCAARFAGDMDKARELAIELRPLVQYLPE